MGNIVQRSMRGTLVATVSSICVALALAVPNATAGETETPGAAAPVVDGISVEYLDGLAASVETEAVEVGAADAYMTDHRVDGSTAKRNLAVQVALAELDDSIARIAGEDLSSTWTHHGEVPVLEVRLAEGADDPRMVKALTELSPLIVVTVGADEDAAKDLEAVTAALAGIDGVVGIGIDGATMKIQVDVEDATGVGDAVRSSLDQAGAPPDNVIVEVSEGTVGDDRRGGLHMSSCTTGFTVQNSSGTRGIITAGHCGDSQSYQLYGSSTWYSMTFQNEARTPSADLQWHTTAATEEPRFHADSTSSSRVLTSSVSSANQGGDYVCSRGKTSGFRCGNVTSTAYRPIWDGACPSRCNAHFVRVGTGNSTGGDSGGPWFNGNAGYGVHKGSGSDFSVYTPVDRFNSMLVSLVYG